MRNCCLGNSNIEHCFLLLMLVSVLGGGGLAYLSFSRFLISFFFPLVSVIFVVNLFFIKVSFAHIGRISVGSPIATLCMYSLCWQPSTTTYREFMPVL